MYKHNVCTRKHVKVLIVVLLVAVLIDYAILHSLYVKDALEVQCFVTYKLD